MWLVFYFALLSVAFATTTTKHEIRHVAKNSLKKNHKKVVVHPSGVSTYVNRVYKFKMNEPHGARSCHPVVTWPCEGGTVTSFLYCLPVCEEPVCTVVEGCTKLCLDPVCAITCPQDQCEAESCPACETLCNPLSCYPNSAGCEIQCEETTCTWSCIIPPWIYHPTSCSPIIESPACGVSSAFQHAPIFIVFVLLNIVLIL